MDLHKIGQNRQTLKELMNDVLDELTELRKLCQHREGELDRARLDYDAVHSLEGLESSVCSTSFAYNLSYAYDTQGTEQGPAALYQDIGATQTRPSLFVEGLRRRVGQEYRD